MSTYESEAIYRVVMADRLREAEHQRLVRQVRRSEPSGNTGAAAAPATRRSRLWKLVHLSHAYG